MLTPETRKLARLALYLAAIFLVIAIVAYFGVRETFIFFDLHNWIVMAFATIAIAWFTYSLRNSTNEQGRLTQKSIDLARDEFSATHRPRIRVRYISIPISPDSGMAFGVIVANIGESDAIITDYQIDVFIPEEPTNIGVDMKPRNFQEVRLTSGQRHTFTNESVNWMPPDELLFLGRITYTNSARQITRMTGFARELDLNWNAYCVSKSHPESEYED